MSDYEYRTEDGSLELIIHSDDAFQQLVTKVGISKEITSVTIMPPVQLIPEDAFINCTSLEEVDLPEGLESIGSRAFMHCTELASVSLPRSLISIDHSAFSLCTKLEKVDLPAGLKSIDRCSFLHCVNLASVSLPSTLTSIGNDAFSHCASLEEVDFPASLTSIGNSAFFNCEQLASVSLPNSLISIGSSAFHNCTSLSLVAIPASVTEIGEQAFENIHPTAVICLTENSNLTKDDLVSKGAPENSRVITISNELHALISRHQPKHQNILALGIEIISGEKAGEKICLADITGFIQKHLGENNKFATEFHQFKTFSQAIILEELYTQLSATATETHPTKATQTIDVQDFAEAIRNKFQILRKTTFTQNPRFKMLRKLGGVVSKVLHENALSIAFPHAPTIINEQAQTPEQKQTQPLEQEITENGLRALINYEAQALPDDPELVRTINYYLKPPKTNAEASAGGESKQAQSPRQPTTEPNQRRPSEAPGPRTH